MREAANCSGDILDETLQFFSAVSDAQSGSSTVSKTMSKHWYTLNPHTGGDLSHIRPGEGGGGTTPPISKSKRDEKARKYHSIALNEYNRKYFESFFRSGQY